MVGKSAQSCWPKVSARFSSFTFCKKKVFFFQPFVPEGQGDIVSSLAATDTLPSATLTDKAINTGVGDTNCKSLTILHQCPVCNDTLKSEAVMSLKSELHCSC